MFLPWLPWSGKRYEYFFHLSAAIEGWDLHYTKLDIILLHYMLIYITVTPHSDESVSHVPTSY